MIEWTFFKINFPRVQSIYNFQIEYINEFKSVYKFQIQIGT